VEEAEEKERVSPTDDEENEEWKRQITSNKTLEEVGPITGIGWLAFVSEEPWPRKEEEEHRHFRWTLPTSETSSTSAHVVSSVCHFCCSTRWTGLWASLGSAGKGV